MKKINILQFISHFPPYKSWLWTVAQEIADFYTSSGFGDVINLVCENEQIEFLQQLPKNQIIEYQWKVIWYDLHWYQVLIVPSFDIVYNFPCPKIFSQQFKIIMTYVASKKIDVVHTHTRFFMRTLRWWIYAKRHKKWRVHTEHWSDYAQLNTRRKTRCARIRDETLWRRILHCSHVVAISKRVWTFVSKLGQKKYQLIYNWINFVPSEHLPVTNKIRIGFIGRLVKLKWVNYLLDAFANLIKKNDNLKLEIVGDWDEIHNLKQQVTRLQLSDHAVFLGAKDRQFLSKEFLPTIDIFVNPSLMEWLPTVVLESLLSECVVVATDVWGTAEISELADLILVKPSNLKDLIRGIETAVNTYQSAKWLSKKHVIETFSWNQKIWEYLEIYNSSLWR